MVSWKSKHQFLAQLSGKIKIKLLYLHVSSLFFLDNPLPVKSPFLDNGAMMCLIIFFGEKILSEIKSILNVASNILLHC